jgi:predicted AAA+ superfamily ATPase
VEELNTVPIREVAHKTLLDLFNRYAIIGGMPEVVRKYVETNNIANLPPIYESIWETYKEDVVKYAANNSEARIIYNTPIISNQGVS